MTNLKSIGATIEQQLADRAGIVVDWTFRTDSQFTVSGAPDQVDQAVAFLAKAGIATLSADIVFDDEIGESFAYLQQAVRVYQ